MCLDWCAGNLLTVWRRVSLKENQFGSWVACRHLRAVRVKLQVPPLRYPGFPVQEIRVLSGRDDKVEGGGQRLHEWRWMDRVKKLIWTSLTLSRPSGLVAIRSDGCSSLASAV